METVTASDTEEAMKTREFVQARAAHGERWVRHLAPQQPLPTQPSYQYAVEDTRRALIAAQPRTGGTAE